MQLVPIQNAPCRSVKAARSVPEEEGPVCIGREPHYAKQQMHFAVRNESCPAGYYLYGGVACLPCPAGTYGTGGWTGSGCAACGSGTYASGTGRTRPLAEIRVLISLTPPHTHTPDRCFGWVGVHASNARKHLSKWTRLRALQQLVADSTLACCPPSM